MAGVTVTEMLEMARRIEQNQVPRYDFEQEPVFRKWHPQTGEEVFFPLHAGQRGVWNSEAVHVAAIAGARSGKTALGPWWVLRELQRLGGGDALIVGPTTPLMKRRLIPECVETWDQTLDMGEYKWGRNEFVFNGKGLSMLGVKRAAVYFGFADDPETLESMEAACAWCDEVGQSKFSRESIEAIRRRVSFSGMSGKAGRILYTTTPYSFNWFKTDIHDKALEKGSKIETFNYLSIDNPLFPKDEWDDAEKTLESWKFDMFYRGKFTRPLGQVFSNFDDKRHVIKPFEIPWHWQRCTGHDFGEVNTAAVKLARNPETEQWILYWDYHSGKIPVEDHVVAFKQNVGPDEEPSWNYGGAPSEDNWRDQFNWAGWYIMKPPVKDRFVGLQQLNSMFARDELLIFDTCQRTIKQIQELSYEIGESGEPNPAKIEKESEYHLVASTRYAVVGVAEGIGEGSTQSAYSFNQ